MFGSTFFYVNYIQINLQQTNRQVQYTKSMYIYCLCDIELNTLMKEFILR